MTTETSLCKLCCQARKLRRSHVIPETWYAAMYGPKRHRFRYMHDVDARKVKWEQNGFKEYLLCEQCEQKLGVWDNYASRLFKTELPTSAQGQAKPILFHGLDYAKLKLFFLSVLWRASVSTLPFFEHVKLGPHEDTIRDMLDRRIPGNPTDYGCVISLLVRGGQPERSFVVEPTPCGMQHHEHDRYRFVFGGFLVLYFLSKQGLTPKLEQAMLQADGSLIIQQMDPDEFDFLKDLRTRVLPPGSDGAVAIRTPTV